MTEIAQPGTVTPRRAGPVVRALNRIRDAVEQWPWWMEVALLLFVGFISVPLPGSPDVLLGDYWWHTALIGLAATVSLLARRRFPVLVTLLTTAAFILDGGALWPLLVAVYGLGTRRPPAVALPVGALTLVTPLGQRLVLGSPAVYGASVALVALLAVGVAAANRRRRVATLGKRVRVLEDERDRHAERARAAERARIAHEMHDILAHRLSLLVLHTGVLEVRAGDLPAPVAEKLGLIRSTGAQALADLRELLGVLHEPAGPAALGPVPVDIAGLVAESRSAGARVSTAIAGELDTLPTAVQLAVYRVVQEALTNARRHAPGQPVRVRVDRTGPEVRVTVRNPMPPAGSPPSDGGGFGLIGLAERVGALGGTVTAEPTAGAEPAFEVHAVLPARPAHAEPATHPAGDAR